MITILSLGCECKVHEQPFEIVCVCVCGGGGGLPQSPKGCIYTNKHLGARDHLAFEGERIENLGIVQYFPPTVLLNKAYIFSLLKSGAQYRAYRARILFLLLGTAGTNFQNLPLPPSLVKRSTP